MSAAGRIAWVLCSLLCGGVAFASPADRRTSAYYAHLDLTSTFAYFDNSWLKSEHHHQSPAAAPTWTPLEATVAGGNRSPETDEISAIPAAGTATLNVDISYEYDLRGNRKVKNDASGTTNDASYDYDLDDRLTAETRGGVGITYGYAKRGDLTTKTVGSATTTYLTDHMGRITALLGDTESWHYTYAPTGDRLNKKDVTIDGSGNEEWYLSSDGDTLIDYTKTGTGLLNFSGIYSSPGIDGRVARTNELGETSYFFGDSLQSVHEVTDGVGDVKRWQFTDAWGNNLDVGKVNTPMGPGDRFSFQGREKDNESGLQHFRARSYDPMTGRFTSRDPVPYPNLYHFENNDPVNNTDPSGRDVGDWWDPRSWAILLLPQVPPAVKSALNAEMTKRVRRFHQDMSDAGDPKKYDWMVFGKNLSYEKRQEHMTQFAKGVGKGASSVVQGVKTLVEVGSITITDILENPESLPAHLQGLASIVAEMGPEMIGHYAKLLDTAFNDPEHGAEAIGQLTFDLELLAASLGVPASETATTGALRDVGAAFSDASASLPSRIGALRKLWLRIKHSKTLAELNSDAPMVIKPPGSASIKEMAELTELTGREVLLGRSQGVRYLVMGTETGVDPIPGTTRIVAHTHPSGILDWSRTGLENDLKAFSQWTPRAHSSVLIAPDGRWARPPIK